MQDPLPQLLIVDDEGEIVPRQLVDGKLNAVSLFDRMRKELGDGVECRIHTALTVEEAFHVLEKFPIDVALLDQNVPLKPGQEPHPRGGLEALRKIKKIGPPHWRDIEALIVTGHSNEENIGEALERLDAFGYLSKPLDYALLRFQVKRAIGRRADRQKIKSLTEQAFSRAFIVGTSEAMRGVFEMINKVSLADSSVLITGESGVGKELVARAVHGNSRRADRPFVAVDCASIPPNLIESELFGHAKGAFTDAVRDKEGLFEQADKGTVFLDEIGELPLDMQTKLLRVLQEKEIKRLGETAVRKIDVRTLAATNRTLEQMVRDGRFRMDLFYRLNVINIHIPPLRERKEDIPTLSRSFLKKFSERADKEIHGFTENAMEKIQAYSWPGNVRELENCVEHAVVMASGDAIRAEDLPAAVTAETVGATAGPRPPAPPSQPVPSGEPERIWKGQRLKEAQIKALMHLREQGKLTKKDYTDLTETNPLTAKDHLRELVEKGIIQLKGAGPKSYYVLSDQYS